MSYNHLLFQFHTGTVVTRGIPDVRLSLWEPGLAGQACGVLRKSLPCDFPLHEDDSHTLSGGCEMLLVQSKCHENCS